VQPDHYEHVGDALLWSIARTVRPCRETAAAWAEAYAALAETMIATAWPDRAA
jgi:hemoglobin-like flavoprotein